MDFNSAMQLFNSGKAIRRSNMYDFYIYRFMSFDSQFGCSFSANKFTEDNPFRSYNLTEEDTQATDWEVVDEETWRLL